MSKKSRTVNNTNNQKINKLFFSQKFLVFSFLKKMDTIQTQELYQLFSKTASESERLGKLRKEYEFLVKKKNNANEYEPLDETFNVFELKYKIYHKEYKNFKQD